MLLTKADPTKQVLQVSACNLETNEQAGGSGEQAAREGVPGTRVLEACFGEVRGDPALCLATGFGKGIENWRHHFHRGLQVSQNHSGPRSPCQPLPASGHFKTCL